MIKNFEKIMYNVNSSQHSLPSALTALIGGFFMEKTKEITIIIVIILN